VPCIVQLLPFIYIVTDGAYVFAISGAYRYAMATQSGCCLMFMEYMDSKVVRFLTSGHSYPRRASGKEKQRWGKETRAYTSVHVPEVKLDYDAHMGGVDHVDQKQAIVRLKYKWRRPAMVNYMWHIEQALSTAHMFNKMLFPAAYKTAKGHSKRTLHDDMFDLVEGLLDAAHALDPEGLHFNSGSVPEWVNNWKPLPLAKDHVYTKTMLKKARCIVCHFAPIAMRKESSKQSMYRGCKACGVALCCEDCFKDFHTRGKGWEKYW
jgi:hypothetical protein